MRESTRGPADPSSCGWHGAVLAKAAQFNLFLKCEVCSQCRIDPDAAVLCHIDVCQRLLEASHIGTSLDDAVNYGDQPAYKSQAFAQSCTHLTSSTQYSQACSSAAALMSFQMPPAIRPFDPNHWLCGSSPLPCSDSGSNYQPVNEGPELNRKPTSRSVPIVLAAQCCTHEHTCLSPSLALLTAQQCAPPPGCGLHSRVLLTHCQIKAAQT